MQSQQSLACPRPEPGHLLPGVVVRQHNARAAREELGDLALGEIMVINYNNSYIIIKVIILDY